MDREVWSMVAWIVGKHGEDAPSIAEQMADRLRREHGDESDIKIWLTIRDAAAKWLRLQKSNADVIQ
jgi:hypothetical protein